MSTAANESLEEHSALMEDNAERSKTGGENVNVSTMSVRSDISEKIDADCSLEESGQTKKDSGKLQAVGNSEKVVDVEQMRRSRVTAAETELSVQMNGDNSKQTKSKQSRSNEAGDFGKADSRYYNSRLSVRSEVAKEAVNLVRDGTVAAASDDITASRTSLSSCRSRTRRRKMKNEEKNEASSQAVSLVSVRSDESQKIADSNTTTSRTSVKHGATKSQIDRSDLGSLVASVVSMRSDEVRGFNDSTKASSFALSDSENVGSQLSVRPSSVAAPSRRSDDVDADSHSLGSTFSVRSLISEVPSNSSSVIISKPPRHVAANKAVKDARLANEAKTSSTDSATGDSVNQFH